MLVQKALHDVLEEESIPQAFEDWLVEVGLNTVRRFGARVDTRADAESEAEVFHPLCVGMQALVEVQHWHERKPFDQDHVLVAQRLSLRLSNVRY